jgi:hypothetical protein
LIFSPLRVLANRSIVQVGRSRPRNTSPGLRCAADRQVHGTRSARRVAIVGIPRLGKRKVHG